jgi:hypothetical protein
MRGLVIDEMFAKKTSIHGIALQGSPSSPAAFPPRQLLGAAASMYDTLLRGGKSNSHNRAAVLGKTLSGSNRPAEPDRPVPRRKTVSTQGCLPGRRVIDFHVLLIRSLKLVVQSLRNTHTERHKL